MAATDTSTAIITGAAAVIGTALGGGISWLSGWGATRRARADARAERRRAAYAAFIAAQNELTRVVFAWKTAENTPAPDARFGDAIAQAVGAVDRATVAITLAGPTKAAASASDVREKAWAIYYALHGPSRGQTGPEVFSILNQRGRELTDAGTQFTETARSILKN